MSDDDWPEPLKDPEEIARARENLRWIDHARRSLLRWTYAGLAILLIIVLVLALTR